LTPWERRPFYEQYLLHPAIICTRFPFSEQCTEECEAETDNTLYNSVTSTPPLGPFYREPRPPPPPTTPSASPPLSPKPDRHPAARRANLQFAIRRRHRRAIRTNPPPPNSGTSLLPPLSPGPTAPPNPGMATSSAPGSVRPARLLGHRWSPNMDRLPTADLPKPGTTSASSSSSYSPYASPSGAAAAGLGPARCEDGVGVAGTLVCPEAGRIVFEAETMRCPNGWYVTFESCAWESVARGGICGAGTESVAVLRDVEVVAVEVGVGVPGRGPSGELRLRSHRKRGSGVRGAVLGPFCG
jgi:hypothetical protein